MKKWIARIGVFVSTVILIVFLGCAIIQDAITPTITTKEAAVYADPNGTVKNVNWLWWLPYDTLYFAKEIDGKMDYVHDTIQIRLHRELADDDRYYGFLKGGHTYNIEVGEQTKQTIFSPTGLGALIPAGCGTLLGGMFIPRRGEKKKIKKAKEEGIKEGIKEANNVAVLKATNNKA